MTNDLQAIAEAVRKVGPTRVIVDGEGLGESPRRASLRRDYQPPTVVFVRDDGWTLGASAKFEHVARELYAREWIGVLRGPDFTEIEDLRR